METIINLSNNMFQPIINLGAPPMMFILISLMSILLGVKVDKALEGGLRLGIALTGMVAVIDILTESFAPALEAFVLSTGIQLDVTDVGWAPLATITWGSPYTLFFLVVLIILNIVLLVINKTDTMDIDIFNFWQLSIVGLLVMHYSDNLLLATFLVTVLGIMKLINADLMKPTFNYLLDTPSSNLTTTAHMSFLLNPVIMFFDIIIDKVLPNLDKYDFDAAWLNKKIGFWGSNFAIGTYLGTFIGLLGRQPLSEIFVLAFIGATSLELFSVVGGWFVTAMQPISQGIKDFISKRENGERDINIGIDWLFLGSRPEIWSVINILVPIILFIALLLPGNRMLPLGGIIAVGLTPPLLVISRGKIIRMILIGILMIPMFLWSGTAIAPFITETTKLAGAFPTGLGQNALISHSTLADPASKFIAILIGRAANEFDLLLTVVAIISLLAYIALFIWYVKEMRIRNEVYKKTKSISKNK